MKTNVSIFSFVVIFLVASFAYCSSDGLSEKFMDWALRNAGIDPNSGESEYAKDFSKDWINPLTDEKQIERDVEGIKSLIIGNEDTISKILSDENLSSEDRTKKIRDLLGSEVKQCEVCERRFPLDFLYCPYHRVRLDISKTKVESHASPVLNKNLKGRRILYVWGDGPPSKFSLLVRRQGVIVDKLSPYKVSDFNPIGYDVVVIHFADEQSSARARMKTYLTKLYAFVKGGGTALLLFSHWTEEVNDALMDLYGMAIIHEVIAEDQSVVNLDGKSYFNFWDGLKVGGYNDSTRTRGSSNKVYLPGYLEVLDDPTSDSAGSGILSSSSGKMRLISAETHIRKGRVIAMIEGAWGDCTYCGQSMFGDNVIDLLDNQDAAKILMYHLFE